MKKLFDKLPVTLTPHAIWYPILSVFSLMLAQGLKMPITYTIFLFAVLCPLGVILQLVIARLSLRVSFRVSSQQPRKNTPFIATATVKNKWALPLPFIKAVMTLPDKYGERDQSVSFLFSLLPFSAKSIDQTVEYAFRGEHSLGVDCIFVYDFMRTVRLRIPVNVHADVFVMPRTLLLENNGTSNDENNPASGSADIRSEDNTESEGIRAYRVGDSLKAVHWKLSSKSEELLVKEYVSESAGETVILCDLEPLSCADKASEEPLKLRERYTDTADLYCTDLAVETVIAVIRRELEKNTPTRLALFQNGVPEIWLFTSEAELEYNFRYLASLKADKTKSQLLKLDGAVGAVNCTHLVMITPLIDKTHYIDCREAATSRKNACTPELRLCKAACMFSDCPGQKAEEQRITLLKNDGFDVSGFKNT